MNDINNDLFDHFDLLGMPLIAIEHNKIAQYNSSAENLFPKFIKSDIHDISYFLSSKLAGTEKLIHINQEKFFIKSTEHENTVYVILFPMDEIFAEYSSFFDISSFLHEIKNPLTVINGTVQLLKNKSKDSYTLKCTEIIDNECSRLENFVDEFGFILDINLNYREFYILEFFEEMLASLKVLFKNVSFSTEISTDLKKMNGDRDKLYRAFYNIIKNACEANPDGNIKIFYTIDTTIKYRDSNKKRLSSMAKFTIIDEAGGIPENIRNKIFTPFFTTKSKGRGLGLIIAREIIEKHKGRLSFDSQNNIGTVFTVLLPI
ncbi:histidine kinase [Flexistipes sinusarabici DSM 4947]|uniref:histidine kinase n=1 Tax=Flexistipes sinusarabici (strain ATCC 49648 / DSM 4947 / MAS 10) TaxID=717231 RepID=F8E6F4_FLESM|nr:ATP-binding protein [Flexistipes sinusarabici]AEI14791.1 histidine kinase [Flexistipes sinusarabici DSM 4947]